MAAAVAACLLAGAAEAWVGETAAALFVVLGVAVAGALFGLVPSLIAATTAFLLYNFFFAEPTMQLNLATKRDLAPLLAFNLAGLVTGAMAGRLRDRERTARIANRRLRELLEASRALQAAVTRDDVERAIARVAADTDQDAWSDEGRAALAALRTMAIERAAFAERVAEAATAARSEEFKTALLSSVSHDLRTPLAAIIASASSLADFGDTLPADARAQLLRTIVSEGDRLNRFTANLLELSRLQFGAPVPRVEIDPADIVASAAERVGERLRGRLHGRVAAGRYLVEADPHLFEAAVVNILDNAVVHAPGSPVELEGRAEDGWFELAVSDHGPGIPEAERARIFDRFRRLDGNRPGSGLGLAIAKGFVEASGGAIEARGRPDGLRGARICIRLPLAPAPTPQREDADAAA